MHFSSELLLFILLAWVLSVAFKAKEQFRTPLMMIVDEADAIAPQKPFPGEERMLGAMNDIVRRGGQRGIGSLLITQRSSVINKDVLTQTQVMIALRTIAKLDLDAIMGWVDVHGDPAQAKVLKESLPALPTGDAWILSPGWPTDAGIFDRIHGNPITTFDSGATPKPGERRVNPKNLADIDLSVLEKRMAEAIERRKQDDPVELKRQIKELQLQLARAKSATPMADPQAISTARAEGAKDALHDMARKLAKYATEVEKRFASIRDLAIATARALDVLPPIPALGDLIALPARDLGVKGTDGGSYTPQPIQQKSVPVTIQTIKPASQKILDALAELQGLGVTAAPRAHIAFLSGYTNLNSKGFTNAIGALRSSRFIDYPTRGTIALTRDGARYASPSPVPRSNAELQERLIAQLGGASGRIVREVVAAYPDSVSREHLAKSAGYGNLNSKGFTNAIGRLRTLGFIDYPAQGRVAAQSILFLTKGAA